MKYNLKNRPKWDEDQESAYRLMFIHINRDWFEGFEKELREKQHDWEQRWKRTPYPHTNLDALVFQAGIGLVKEILGEA